MMLKEVLKYRKDWLVVSLFGIIVLVAYSWYKNLNLIEISIAIVFLALFMAGAWRYGTWAKGKTPKQAHERPFGGN